jgi:hypothetical protein
VGELVAALGDAPPVGQRPQGGEGVLVDLDLVLAPDVTGAVLDRQERAPALAPDAQLGVLGLEVDVALLDGGGRSVVEPVRRGGDGELALDLVAHAPAGAVRRA